MYLYILTFNKNLSRCPSTPQKKLYLQMEYNLPFHLVLQATSILSLLLFFYFVLTRKTNTNDAKQTPPQPSGSWPLLGHLPLLGNLPHINLAKLADNYGPLIMIKLGINRALVVSSSTMAKECLGTNDKVFATRPNSISAQHLAYNSALLGYSPYGEYWRQMRKITTVELLSNQRIGFFKDIRVSEIRSAIKVIFEKSRNGEFAIDMKQWFHDLSINSIVRLISGKSLKEFYNNGEEYYERARAFSEFFELAGAFVIGDAVPFLKWLDIGGYEKRMKRVFEKIDNLAERWLKEHKERRGGKDMKGKKDFMDIMIDLFEDGKGSFPGFEDVNTIIKANCMSTILAGSDTTSTTLTWALSLLLNNKHILQKTKDELNFVVSKKRQVEESDLKNLPYLQAVLKETMRLYPAGPLSVPREALTDCTVANYHIPAGTRLLVNLHKIHRDPQVWEDPLEFNPERFLVKHKHFDVRGKNYEFIPFGTGRRMCPGISYALQVMQFTLANLLHGFEIRVPFNGVVDMSERFGLTNVKAKPLEVIVKPCLEDHLYNNTNMVGVES